MRFEIYLSIGGRHFDAESFSVQADIPGSCTKEIGRRGAEVCPNLISRLQVLGTTMRVRSHEVSRLIMKQ